MELVPIIYNSLIVVISLLCLVLFLSFLFSKVLNQDISNKVNTIKSKNDFYKPSIKTNITSNHFGKAENTKDEKMEFVIEPDATQILVDKNLISKNKIRVVNKSKINKKEKKLTRYLIVNSFPQENTVNNNLYPKFSKMTVKYSQS